MLLKEFENENASDEQIADFVENFDHHSTFFRDNYFNIIRYIVSKKPIFRSPAYGGFSMVCNYEAMRVVATDTKTFPNENSSRVIPSGPLPPLIPVDLNPPDHTFYRRALNPLFSPNAMARRRDDTIQLARELLAAVRKKDHFDLIDDYAKPLTGITSFELLGIEPTTWPDYDTPITNSTFSIGTLEERASGYLAYEHRVREAVAKAVKQPDPATVIGAMALSTLDNRNISEDEICQTVNTLIIGGLGTTQAVAGSSALYLSRNPERKRELIEHPERLSFAVNEFLRLFSSAPITGRAVPDDVQLFGEALHAGETLGLFWAAANFDPNFIDRPFEVDFQRASSRSITFAMGPHMCLGQHLARLELEAMIMVLLEDMPNYAIIDDGIVPAPDVASILAFVHVPVRAG
jgi:cytochrome P450